MSTGHHKGRLIGWWLISRWLIGRLLIGRLRVWGFRSLSSRGLVVGGVLSPSSSTCCLPHQTPQHNRNRNPSSRKKAFHDVSPLRFLGLVGSVPPCWLPPPTTLRPSPGLPVPQAQVPGTTLGDRWQSVNESVGQRAPPWALVKKLSLTRLGVKHLIRDFSQSVAGLTCWQSWLPPQLPIQSPEEENHGPASGRPDQGSSGCPS